MAKSGNNGNSTGQSAASAQSQAAAGNAAASNAANGNGGTGNTGTGNTGTATSASQAQSQAASGHAAASNAAGLNASSAKGNASNSNSSNSMFSGGIPGLGGESFQSWQSNQSSSNETYGPSNSAEAVFSGLLSQPTQTESRKGFIGAFAKNTETPAEHYSQLATQRNRALTKAYITLKNGGTNDEALHAYASSGPFSTGFGSRTTSKVSQKQTNADMDTLYNIGNNNNNAPAATTNSFTPTSPADTSVPTAVPTANVGGETGGDIAGTTSETDATSVNDALNTGITYRGGTVSTPSGTSVTDSGTGGSISSNINLPSRNASSIGLGVYDNDRANYDQDNWNRGMEVESSSLVSDEECKAFAKRAFMENSEPFKKVRVTIIKKC